MGDELTQRIIGAAIEVHRILGPGLMESIYEAAFCTELELRGILYEKQVPIEVKYKGNVIRGQRLDLLVANEVVVELKAIVKVPEVLMAQVLTYLKITGIKRGLLINFHEPRLIDGIRRISN